MTIKIVNHGTELGIDDEKVSFHSRALTNNEVGHLANLQTKGKSTGYDYPHWLYDAVQPSISFGRYRRDQISLLVEQPKIFLGYLKQMQAAAGSRLFLHTFQMPATNPRDMTDFVYKHYYDAQMEADSPVIKISDESADSKLGVLSERLDTYSSKVKEVGKIPMVELRIDTADKYVFGKKLELAIDEYRLPVCFEYRSIPNHAQQYLDLAKFYGKAWIHCSSGDRQRPMKDASPVSLSSLLSIVGVNTTSLRVRGGFEPDITLANLSILDSQTAGFLTLSGWQKKYGSALPTSFGFDAVAKVKDFKEFSDYCKSTEGYHLLYAYESIASWNLLNESSKQLTTRQKMRNYVDSKECLAQHVDALGLLD
jgi:hypothetical protein